jgi:hypothetical protein
MRRGCGVISVARLARTFGESKQTVSAVSDAVETAARPELIHVRYFVACLGDPQSRAAADMLGCEQLGKRHELAAIGEAGQPPAWPRPPKLRRGVTRDRLLGSCVLYGELPTTRAPIRASGRRGHRKSKRWQRGPLIDSLGALELAGIERPSADPRIERRGRSARHLHVSLPSLPAAHRKPLYRARLLFQELREDRRLAQGIQPNP